MFIVPSVVAVLLCLSEIDLIDIDGSRPSAE